MRKAFKKATARRKKPIRVILLDLDGVLITHRASHGLVKNFNGGLLRRLDPVAVGLFNKLAAPADVETVLISSLRFDRGIRQRLKREGVETKWNSDWRTKRLPHKRKRGWEVREWLKRHPEVIAYVILEDGSDFLPSQKPRLVRSPCYDGLTFQNYLDARRILATPLTP